MSDDETPSPIRPHYDLTANRAEIRLGPTEGDFERARPAELAIPTAFYAMLAQARHDKWAFGRITHTQHQELLAWEERLKAVNDPLAAVAVLEIGAIIHAPTYLAEPKSHRVLCPTCGAEFQIEGGGA